MFNCLKYKNTETVLVVLLETIAFNITEISSLCFFIAYLLRKCELRF